MRHVRGWMPLEVVALERETPDTVTAVLVDPVTRGRLFDYRAGQYLTFRFDTLAARPLVRSYTLSSSPCQQDHLRVTVKAVAGGVVSQYFCHTLAVGDVLHARGPMGRFCYPVPAANGGVWMLGAGSGITPFISMLRQVTTEGILDHAVRLVASFRSEQDIICRHELEQIARHPQVQVQIYLSRQNAAGFAFGRLSPDQLDAECEPWCRQPTTFMSCGPEPLMQTLSEILRRRGVSESRLLSEAF